MNNILGQTFLGPNDSPLDFNGNSGKRSRCNRATSDAFIFRLLWGSSMDENPSLGK